MEGTHQQQQRWAGKPSLWCTLLTQACLCIALYVALSIGRPPVPRIGEENDGYVTRAGRHRDLYFMSVRGGARPLEQQAQLLRQMDNVARVYGVEFVVNLSELGDNDPLMQNASLHFPTLKVSWYVTATSVEEGRGYFLKQIELPYDRTLDIISLNTGLWQGSLPKDEQSNLQNDQLHWLTRTLAATRSNWHLVVGFHSLADCEELCTAEKINFYEHLHHTFLKYKVNACLSNHASGGHYTHEGVITYIQNKSLGGQNSRSHAENRISRLTREIGNGFHLHRVGPMEIESIFVNSAGDVVSKSTVHQWGREDM